MCVPICSYLDQYVSHFDQRVRYSGRNSKQHAPPRFFFAAFFVRSIILFLHFLQIESQGGMHGMADDSSTNTHTIEHPTQPKQRLRCCPQATPYRPACNAQQLRLAFEPPMRIRKAGNKKHNMSLPGLAAEKGAKISNPEKQQKSASIAQGESAAPTGEHASQLAPYSAVPWEVLAHARARA